MHLNEKVVVYRKLIKILCIFFKPNLFKIDRKFSFYIINVSLKCDESKVISEHLKEILFKILIRK